MPGACSSGTKIPEMKTSGNLISDESIMMFEGTFVGGTASSIPIAEKQPAARRTAAASVTPWRSGRPIARPMAMVTAVIPMPKRIEAIMSPRTIVSIRDRAGREPLEGLRRPLPREDGRRDGRGREEEGHGDEAGDEEGERESAGCP